MDQTSASTVDFRLLLAKYMRVVVYCEGKTYVNECTNDAETSIVVFSDQELRALDEAVIHMQAHPVNQEV